MSALYYPAQDDNLPCKAHAGEIHDGRVDLVVEDHFGLVHLRQFVHVGMCNEPDYCVLV